MPDGGAPRLLLDTHVWIWLLNGEEGKIRASCLAAIDDAASRSSLLISVISVWEVGMLEAKGRISLSRDCLAWIEVALAQPGFSLAALTPEIAVHSSRLPGAFHGDPADRILMATARCEGATLVTKDKRLIAYGRRHLVAVREA